MAGGGQPNRHVHLASVCCPYAVNGLHGNHISLADVRDETRQPPTLNDYIMCVVRGGGEPTRRNGIRTFVVQELVSDSVHPGVFEHFQPRFFLLALAPAEDVRLIDYNALVVVRRPRAVRWHCNEQYFLEPWCLAIGGGSASRAAVYHLLQNGPFICEECGDRARDGTMEPSSLVAWLRLIDNLTLRLQQPGHGWHGMGMIITMEWEHALRAGASIMNLGSASAVPNLLPPHQADLAAGDASADNVMAQHDIGHETQPATAGRAARSNSTHRAQQEARQRQQDGRNRQHGAHNRPQYAHDGQQDDDNAQQAPSNRQQDARSYQQDDDSAQQAPSNRQQDVRSYQQDGPNRQQDVHRANQDGHVRQQGAGNRPRSPVEGGVDTQQRPTAPLAAAAVETRTGRSIFTELAHVGENDPDLRSRPRVMGVVVAVPQPPTHSRGRGRYRAMVVLKDPSCSGENTARRDFALYIFTREAAPAAFVEHLQYGNILYARAVKVEHYNNKLDGRVFDWRAVSVYSADQQTPVEDLCGISEHSSSQEVREHVRWLRHWYRTEGQRMTELVATEATIGSVSEPGLYAVLCHARIVQELSDAVWISIQDGTCSNLPTLRPEVLAQRATSESREPQLDMQTQLVDGGAHELFVYVTDRPSITALRRFRTVRLLRLRAVACRVGLQLVLQSADEPVVLALASDQATHLLYRIDEADQRRRQAQEAAAAAGATEQELGARPQRQQQEVAPTAGGVHQELGAMPQRQQQETAAPAADATEQELGAMPQRCRDPAGSGSQVFSESVQYGVAHVELWSEDGAPQHTQETQFSPGETPAPAAEAGVAMLAAPQSPGNVAMATAPAPPEVFSANAAAEGAVGSGQGCATEEPRQRAATPEQVADREAGESSTPMTILQSPSRSQCQVSPIVTEEEAMALIDSRPPPPAQRDSSSWDSQSGKSGAINNVLIVENQAHPSASQGLLAYLRDPPKDRGQESRLGQSDSEREQEQRESGHQRTEQSSPGECTEHEEQRQRASPGPAPNSPQSPSHQCGEPDQQPNGESSRSPRGADGRGLDTVIGGCNRELPTAPGIANQVDGALTATDSDSVPPGSANLRTRAPGASSSEVSTACERAGRATKTKGRIRLNISSPSSEEEAPLPKRPKQQCTRHRELAGASNAEASVSASSQTLTHSSPETSTSLQSQEENVAAECRLRFEAAALGKRGSSRILQHRRKPNHSQLALEAESVGGRLRGRAPRRSPVGAESPSAPTSDSQSVAAEAAGPASPCSSESFHTAVQSLEADNAAMTGDRQLDRSQSSVKLEPHSPAAPQWTVTVHAVSPLRASSSRVLRSASTPAGRQLTAASPLRASPSRVLRSASTPAGRHRTAASPLHAASSRRAGPRPSPPQRQCGGVSVRADSQLPYVEFSSIAAAPLDRPIRTGCRVCVMQPEGGFSDEPHCATCEACDVQFVGQGTLPQHCPQCGRPLVLQYVVGLHLVASTPSIGGDRNITRSAAPVTAILTGSPLERFLDAPLAGHDRCMGPALRRVAQLLRRPVPGTVGLLPLLLPSERGQPKRVYVVVGTELMPERQ